MSTSPLALTTTTTDAVNAAMKEHYKPQRVKAMVYENNPLLAMMPKYEKFGGENLPIPLIVTGPQRRSADFATGQANTSNSTLRQFLLTRSRDYSFALVEHEAIKASASNTDAFVRYATMEIDGAIHSLKRSLAVAMYRDGTGQIGRIASKASQTFTLSDADDTSNFEVGMTLNCFDAVSDTSTDSRFMKPDSTDQSDGDVVVSAVDRSAGTVTVTGTVTNMVADDVFCQKGDINAKISGLEAWCPRVLDSSNATIFGVDRTADSTRLGGNRFDGSALPIEEALIGGASQVAREGGAPDHIFMDFSSYANLEKALGSKVQYDKVKSSDADVGFDALVLNGPRGRMKVIPDHNCQPNVAWMLQLNTWSLNTLGAAPQILDADGAGTMLRIAALDAYEVRIGYYGNIACNAPGYNCRVALA